MTLQQLFSRPDTWIKNVIAENSFGNAVDADSPYAIRWCLIGGYMKCYPKGNFAIIDRLRMVIKTTHNMDIVTFNNHPNTTFADIRRVIEEANV